MKRPATFAELALARSGKEGYWSKNSDLLSVYVNGRQLLRSEVEHVVQYIGRGIDFTDKEKNE